MTEGARPRRIADRYVIEQELGSGGMGVVLRARDERLDRSVAIKLLSPASLGSATARARLVREAKSAAALDHPGIVRVYDVGETDDGGAFLVMELVRGKSFGDVLRAGELGRAERLRILVEIANALAYAHREGFVHRDIKPDNIMIRDDGRVIVLDFGLAQIIEPHAAETLASDAPAGPKRLTAEGTVVGSPGYMAPEQVAGEAVDQRADQFALGVMAYEALTGRTPWSATSVIRILMQVVGETPPAPTSVASGLPAAVDVVIGRAMEKRPDDRFLSMDQMAAALSSIELDATLVGGRRADAEAETIAAGAVSHPSPPRSSSPRSAPSSPAPSSGPLPSSPSPPSSTPSLSSPSAAPPSPSGEAAAQPARPARDRRAITAIVALLVVACVGLAARFRRPEARSPPPPPAPLAEPTSALACPILAVEGVEEPAGWLGAAVATMACARARVLLGGRAARALVPADLLALPRMPSDRFPVDPFGAPGTREASLKAARERAAAHLDGSVRKARGAFEVELALVARDGRRVAEGHGAGSLVEAVRAAMTPLVGPAAIPRATAIDTALLGWSDARDVESMTTQLDFMFAMSQFGPGFVPECARTSERREAFGGLWHGTRRWCAYVPGLPLPAEAAPPLDRTTPERFMQTVEGRLAADVSLDVRAAADELERLRKAATDTDRRATIAALESCLRQAQGELGSAHELALQAVEADPTGEDGVFCTRVAQLESVATGPTSARAALLFAQAWKPWNATAWYDGELSPDADPLVLTRLRRAHTLAPYHADMADQLGRALLRRKEREEARAIAASLAAGPPVPRATSVLLGVRLLASETAFGAAIERARRGLATLDGGGYVDSVRLDLASLAVHVAAILGRSEPVADEAVRLLVEPDLPKLTGGAHNGSVAVVELCLHASRAVAERCLARARSLVERGFFVTPLPGLIALLDGAEAFVRGDRAAAAKAWRPLVRKSPEVLSRLAAAMSAAFDATKEVELAELADAAERGLDPEFGGATPAVIRMARRAEQRGDRARARELARVVVDAWVAADEQVPALAEMRALLGEAAPKGSAR